MDYCSYYQAQIDRQQTWFFVGCLKSFEHIAFDRTLDAQEGIFEFFVPADMEASFLEFMQYFVDKKIVGNLKKLPNRLTNQMV